MGKTDIMEIEILDDGTIKVITDKFTPANHKNADEFLKFMAQLAGGEVTKQRKTATHTHVAQTEKAGLKR